MANWVGLLQELSQFDVLKDKLNHAHILVLPDCSKTFELECDAFKVSISVVLLQGGHPIAHFSQKLREPTLNYTIYHKKALCSHLCPSNLGALLSDSRIYPTH